MPVTIKILLDQYTEILRKIYGSHLKTVILYGSYARGDYKADSDIDIMILLSCFDTVIKLDHNQFVSTNRNAAVELKITLEAFGTDHKNEIVKALEDAGCRPKVIRPSL